MDISQANKQAELLLGKHAEVRYLAETFTYQVGLNNGQEFVLWGESNASWEDALAMVKDLVGKD